MRLSRLFHLTLRQKLFFGFGVNVLLVAVIVLSTVISMDEINVSLAEVRDQEIPKAMTGLEIDFSIYRMVDNVEASIRTGNQSMLDDAAVIQRNLARPLGELIFILEDDPDSVHMVQQLDTAVKNFIDSGSQLFRAKTYEQDNEAAGIQKQYFNHRFDLLNQTENLKKNGTQVLDAALSDINRLGSKTRQLTLVLGSVAIFVGILVLVAFSYVIMKPVRQLIKIMKLAEQGDFTGRYVNPYLTPCWVQMKCSSKDCTAYMAEDLRCWQMAGTRCNHGVKNPSSRGENSCDSCKVYLKATREEFSGIGEAFNNMMSGISKLISLLQEAESQVSDASRDLLNLSEDLRLGSDQQARSVDEVTSSIEEMNCTIRNMAQSADTYCSAAEESNTSVLQMTASVEEVAHSAELLTGYVQKTGDLLDDMTASIREVAQHSGNLSQQVEQSSSALLQIETSIKEIVEGTKNSSELASLVTDKLMKEGHSAVDRTAESMVGLREIVTDAAEIMGSLTQRSNDIGKMLQVIEDVSDQTRLLSLNAAILAAQSGTQGRSFSVVAEEIRELSDRTSTSTQEINQLLSNIPIEIGNVTKAIKTGTDKVDDGVRLIEEVKKAIDIVSEAARKSAEASSMIMLVTDEQANSIRQAAELEQNIATMSKEITDAMKYQTENCGQIITSATQMKDLASVVMTATDEQAKGTKLLSHTSSETMKIAKKITEATKEEAQGSELILKSIDSVSQATSRNMEVFAHLSELVASLNQHSRMLHGEMGRFRVKEGSSGFSVQSPEEGQEQV